MELTDAQWARLEPLIPVPVRRADGKGRPALHPRPVLNGILWILQTGARWKDLPSHFPPYPTCHRWFQKWQKDGVFDRILVAVAEDLLERGGIDVRECFIDGTFASAKKGVLTLGKQSGGRGRRSWQLQTAMVFLSPSARQALRRMK
jgi:transposase